MKPDARIVVIAPNWLGDAVMSLFALADLREEFAGATLAVAARPPVAPLFAMVQGVDRVVTLAAGRSAVKANAAALAGAFDVAIVLPNSFASTWMAARAQIPERWGYRADWRARWLTRAVPRPSGGHQVAYYRDLVRALGIGPARDPLAIALPAEARQRAADALTAEGWDGTSALVGIAPGAAYGTAKQWPPEYFAALIHELRDQDHATAVLVGTAADAATGKQISADLVRRGRPSAFATASADRSGRPTINLIGRTDLVALAATLSLCRAFVSNDSGAMHLASALGVPVTAIFGSTNERETAPRGRRGGPDPRIITHEVFCRPCMLRECPIDHRCMRRIEPARVAAACRTAMPA